MGEPKLNEIIEEMPLSDLIPQQRNLNKHTPRGMGMLEDSLQKVGWIGAGTMAANGEIFDGSARHEKADLLGKNAIIINSDGTRPIYIKRTDIPTADDERAVRAGILANRVSEINLQWDNEELLEIQEAGEIDLGDYWFKDELSQLLDIPLDLSDIDNAEQNQASGSGQKEIKCTCPKCGHEFIQNSK